MLTRIALADEKIVARTVPGTYIAKMHSCSTPWANSSERGHINSSLRPSLKVVLPKQERFESPPAKHMGRNEAHYPNRKHEQQDIRPRRNLRLSERRKDCEVQADETGKPCNDAERAQALCLQLAPTEREVPANLQLLMRKRRTVACDRDGRPSEIADPDI